MTELPRDKPIFSFCGDDCAGSTESLDALARQGVRAVLFLHAPTAAELCGFPGVRAVGIAGAPPAALETLRQIGAPVVLYQGSIDGAVETGREALGVPFVPVAPAAPLLRRYVVFGHLFAASGDAVLHQADLRLHLSRQNSSRVSVLDIVALGQPDARDRLERLIEEQPDSVVFDGLDEANLDASAALIWESRCTPQSFVVGSAAFTRALLRYWRTRGWLDEPVSAAAPASAPHPGGPMVAMSGSCSPVTERQIQHALRAGFSGIRLNAAQLARTGSNGPYQELVLSKALGHLSKGHSVILYSALGPLGDGEARDGQALASEMGKLLRALIARSGVHRAAVAGGDTCSHAVRELDISALTFLAPLEPGVPLCQAFGKGAKSSGLELALKGGQVGSESFFEKAL